MSEALTTLEATELAECEEIIERGLATFVEVGRALLTIRDSRLYRQTHGTFDSYAKERWGWTRSYAYRLIQGAEMSPIGNIHNEAQARELARVPEESRAEVWERVQGSGEKVTARAIREVASTVNAEVLYDPKRVGVLEGELEDESEYPRPAEEGEILFLLDMMHGMKVELEQYTGMEDMAETVGRWMDRLNKEVGNA